MFMYKIDARRLWIMFSYVSITIWAIMTCGTARIHTIRCGKTWPTPVIKIIYNKYCGHYERVLFIKK
jgi:hypothetical protein